MNNDLYNSLPEELRKVIIDTKVISGHWNTSGETNFTSTYKIYLLSLKEVYEDATGDSADYQTRQLDYYKNKGLLYSNRDFSAAIKQYNGSNELWWVRSSYKDSNETFGYILDNGPYNYLSPIYFFGISPAFRIG